MLSPILEVKGFYSQEAGLLFTFQKIWIKKRGSGLSTGKALPLFGMRCELQHGGPFQITGGFNQPPGIQVFRHRAGHCQAEVIPPAQAAADRNDLLERMHYELLKN